MQLTLLAVLFTGLSLSMQLGGLSVPALGLGLVGSICLDIAIWNGIVKQSGFSIALKVFFAYTAFRKIFPLLICVLAFPLPTESFPWGFAILKYPLIAVAGYSIEGWCAALLIFFGQSLTQQRAFAVRDLAAFATRTPSISWFLGLAAITSLIWWLAITQYDNRFFFLVRKFHAALAFAPFFAGLTCRVFPVAGRLWVVVLMLQFGISFITGTRGGAFYPAIYFLIGYLIGTPRTEERNRVFMYRVAPILGLLFAFGVIIGAARDAVGRTDLVTAINEGTLFSKINFEKVFDRINSGDGFLMSGLIRMTSLPPLAAPNLSPEPVPFRGFEDFGDELAAAGTTRLFSGEEGLRFYWANWCLKPYGFAVNTDAKGRKTSSVELSAFVDGFTRGGWLIGIAWCLIGYTIWATVEILARNFSSYFGSSMLLGTLIAIMSPDRFGVHGLMYEVKLLFIDVLLCAAVAYGISLLFPGPSGIPVGSPRKRWVSRSLGS